MTRCHFLPHLHRATSEFISSDLWPLNSPDLNRADYKIWDCLQDWVYGRSAYAASMSWNSVWLRYGQTRGRPSLTRPWMCGGSEHLLWT